MLDTHAIIYPDRPKLPRPSGDVLDIAPHREWFEAYAKEEMRLVPEDRRGPMELKLEHTMRVLDNASRISSEEGFPPVIARACLLAALYHDLSRFEQYRVWGTFRDPDSCNHGELSEYLLRVLGLLDAEPPLIAEAACRACGLHNVFALPDGLPSDVTLVTRTVRDADKLDILRVFDEEFAKPEACPVVLLSRPDVPGLFSEKVLADAMAHRTAGYADLRSANDFRVLLGTWIWDLNYPASRRQCVRDGHARRIVEGLPGDAVYAEVRRELLATLDAIEG